MHKYDEPNHVEPMIWLVFIFSKKYLQNIHEQRKTFISHAYFHYILHSFFQSISPLLCLSNSRAKEITGLEDAA